MDDNGRRRDGYGRIDDGWTVSERWADGRGTESGRLLKNGNGSRTGW